MGHTGNIGYAIAGWIGKWFGDKSNLQRIWMFHNHLVFYVIQQYLLCY